MRDRKAAQPQKVRVSETSNVTARPHSGDWRAGRRAACPCPSVGRCINHGIGERFVSPSARRNDDDGVPDLARAAVEAVGGWRYEPTLLHGVPVDTRITISVTFVP